LDSEAGGNDHNALAVGSDDDMFDAIVASLIDYTKDNKNKVVEDKVEQ